MENNCLVGFLFIELGEDKGLEDFVINVVGIIVIVIYFGVVLFKKKGEVVFILWINIGGCLFGIEFDINGNLLIVDVYCGLLIVDFEGELMVLVN